MVLGIGVNAHNWLPIMFATELSHGKTVAHAPAAHLLLLRPRRCQQRVSFGELGLGGGLGGARRRLALRDLFVRLRLELCQAGGAALQVLRQTRLRREVTQTISGTLGTMGYGAKTSKVCASDSARLAVRPS